MAQTNSVWFSTSAVIVAALALGAASTIKVHAEGDAGAAVIVQAADPAEQGDGTMGPAAAASWSRGPLPFSAATARMKSAADQAYATAARSGALRPASAGELAAAEGPGGCQQPQLPRPERWHGFHQQRASR